MDLALTREALPFELEVIGPNYSMPKTLSFIDINETYLKDSISTNYLCFIPKGLVY